MQLFWRRRCSGFRRAAFGAGDSETILKVDQFGFERGDSAGQHPLPASRRTSRLVLLVAVRKVRPAHIGIDGFAIKEHDFVLHATTQGVALTGSPVRAEDKS